jgi:hypothetical protein
MRDAQLADWTAIPVTIGVENITSFDQRLERFFDEERVAFGQRLQRF